MSRIEAPPSEMMGVGAEITALAPGITTLDCIGGSLSSGVDEPPATAAALERLGTTWSRGAMRLEDELSALGRAVQAAAIAYQTTDQTSMQGRPS
jgi:hypothetical protein